MREILYRFNLSLVLTFQNKIPVRSRGLLYTCIYIVIQNSADKNYLVPIYIYLSIKLHSFVLMQYIF